MTRTRTLSRFAAAACRHLLFLPHSAGFPCPVTKKWTVVDVNNAHAHTYTRDATGRYIEKFGYAYVLCVDQSVKIYEIKGKQLVAKAFNAEWAVVEVS